jgi:hypothetical protein
MDDWKNWRVVDVKLPTRLRTVLVSVDADMTMEQLDTMNAREILAMPNAGKAVVQMAVEVLRDAYSGKLDKINHAKTLGDLAKATPHE